MRGYVLVGGWPGSGKTTTARLLARRLGWAYLSKDEVKEALMDEFGTPKTLAQSRRLGRAAVTVVLRVAQQCPAAVIDSTWFDYTLPMVAMLKGPMLEVRCIAPLDVIRARYRERVRDPRHLDAARSEDELWGHPVAPLGVGPLIEVETTAAVDVDALAERVSVALAAQLT